MTGALSGAYLFLEDGEGNMNCLFSSLIFVLFF